MSAFLQEQINRQLMKRRALPLFFFIKSLMQVISFVCLVSIFAFGSNQVIYFYENIVLAFQ